MHHHTFTDTRAGRLHHTDVGTGPVLLMLHQTPRSADEFVELQTALGTDHRTVALDMPGFGLSPRLPAPQRIETMADGALALLEQLATGPVVVVGHHTGAVVALEMAARAPGQVRALVLSAMPWVDEARRSRSSPPVDHATPAGDGSHLHDLWHQRSPHYPRDRPDLLDRFIRDALAPGLDPAEGHRAVGRYRMEERAPLVSCPTLLVVADADPFSSPYLPAVSAGLAHVPVLATHHIHDGTIPLMETAAPEVAAAVRTFLADLP